MAELTIPEFQAYLDDCNKENAHGTERGTVLVGVSVLDDLLLRILQEFMIDDAEVTKKLFGSRGPLSAFSARIDTCFTLGLITQDEANILHKCRDIRNDFAHKIGVTLRSQSLEARCHYLYEMTTHTEEERRSRGAGKGDPRLAFGSAALRMAIILNQRLTATVPQKRIALLDQLELAERGYAAIQK